MGLDTEMLRKVKFSSWIKMNVKNAKTSILTNGFRTNYFKIYLAQCDRVAQSISPLLYILHAEPFACAIRKKMKIELGYLCYTSILILVNKQELMSFHMLRMPIFASSNEPIVEPFKITEKCGEKTSGAKIHKQKQSEYF